jgi:prepilin-type N-terminal cleavage/methylation domain-containing protein
LYNNIAIKKFVSTMSFDAKSFAHFQSHVPARGAGRSSFTLIELLIVIGILAILVAIVVAVLNPSELFAQARDARRQQDISTINAALQSAMSSESVTSFGTPGTVYVSIPSVSPTCADLSLPALAAGWVYHCVPSAMVKNIDGSGWIPIDMSSLSVQVVSSLPVDPINSTSSNAYYTYMVNANNQFELTATMESQKQLQSSGLAAGDGGTDPSKYEMGSVLNLWTQASGLSAWWAFDGGTSGSIADGQTAGLEDASGLGNNGTAVGVMAWTSGRTGGAVSFNGTNDTILLSDANDYLDPGTGSMSWIFWAKFTTSSQMNPYRNSFASNASGTIFYFGSGVAGRFTCVFGVNNSVVVGTAGGYNDNKWHQFACVLNRSTSDNTAKIYVDGALNVSASSASLNGVDLTNLPPPSGYPPYIGSSLGTSGFFQGAMDNFRIYKRALSAPEIQSMYNAGD